MKKKNIILLIIAIVLFVLLGSTMAYFGWSSSLVNKDQLVDVTVSGGTGSCDKLEDNQKLLYPTSTREKGRILKVTAKQQMATNAIITWNLVINSINESTLTTSGLKHNSFKYELVNDTTAVSYGTGNFENVTNGTTITLSTDKETLDYNTEYTFILYLWIDGTIGNNPLDMANQPYNFDLNCNITGTSTKITPPDTYQLTNGDGSTYTPTYNGSGTKVVRSTAPLNKFKEVRVDNTVVASSNYTLTEGSTIVTFKESYLKTLSVGDHSIKIVSDDGFTTGTLTVKELITAATYISNLYNNSTKTPVKNNRVTYQYDTSHSLMKDVGNNIRYYGANPNNYIYFNCSTYPSTNCETWRIIGVFDGKVKIMRNESIGDLAWDQDKNIDSSKVTFDNDWSTASLKVLLNEKYYNGNTTGTVIYYSGADGSTSTSLNMTNIGIKNDTTRNMIAEVTWNLGSVPEDDYDFPYNFSNELYVAEREAEAYAGNTTVWTGRIALPYASDYGYAADLNKCSECFDSYYDSTCTANNWMKSILKTSNGVWLLTTCFSDFIKKNYASCVDLDGAGLPSLVHYSRGVVPALHLSANLSIESGDGTSSSPYRLSV